MNQSLSTHHDGACERRPDDVIIVAPVRPVTPAGPPPPVLDRDRRHRLVVGLGFWLLAGGGLLFALSALERSGLLVLTMPDLWYSGRPLVDFLALGSALAGVRLMRHSRNSGWAPRVPGRRFHTLVVYTRKNCPLCDEACELLLSYRPWLPPPTPVDIDDDPALFERYTNCVPIVQCDGKVRFRGRVDEALLRRLIEGTRPL